MLIKLQEQRCKIYNIVIQLKMIDSPWNYCLHFKLPLLALVSWDAQHKKGHTLVGVAQ